MHGDDMVDEILNEKEPEKPKKELKVKKQKNRHVFGEDKDMMSPVPSFKMPTIHPTQKGRFKMKKKV